MKFNKKNLLILSGHLGGAKLREFYRPDDGRSDFMIVLVEKLSEIYNIFYSVSDIESGQVDLEIHINFQFPKSNAPRVCILLEDFSIRPQNIFCEYFDYKLILTFNNSLVDRLGAVKFYFPHDVSILGNEANCPRPLDFVMLATNRNVLLNKRQSLYDVRTNVIEEFEKLDGSRFHLYGRGWDYDFCGSGFLGRFAFELKKHFKNQKSIKLKSWKGLAPVKHDILKASKFNFCFENVLGISGYISEKLYDSFACGSIPIYIPSGEDALLSEAPYINYLDFRNLDELLTYVDGMNNSRFEEMREKGFDFLRRNANIFSSYAFTTTVIKELSQILTFPVIPPKNW